MQVSLSPRFRGDRQEIVKPFAVGVQRFMRRHLFTAAAAAFWVLKCTLIPDYTSTHPKRQQLIGRAIVLGIYRRPLIAEAGVQSQASSCESFGRQSENTTGFCQGNFGFSVSVSFHECSKLIHSNITAKIRVRS
jgi:hypothetical protein